MGEKTKEVLAKPSLKKYLITWSLDLGKDDLEKMSRRPEVLQKGLKYVKNASRKNALNIYRIGSMAEVTHFTRPGRGMLSESANPHGIAIAEATSIEEARKLIDVLVEGLGFGFGSVPVKNYLEYDINPLIEITAGGRQ